MYSRILEVIAALCLIGFASAVFPQTATAGDLTQTGYEAWLNVIVDGSGSAIAQNLNSYINMTGVTLTQTSFAFETRLMWTGQQNMNNISQTFFFYGDTTNYIWFGGLPTTNAVTAPANIYVVIKNQTGLFSNSIASAVKNGRADTWFLAQATLTQDTTSIYLYSYSLQATTLQNSMQSFSGLGFDVTAPTDPVCYMGWAPTAVQTEILAKINGNSFGNLTARVDEIRIFNGPRSTSDFFSDLGSHVGGTEPNIYAVWQIQETSGTTITDLVSSRVATIINGQVAQQKGNILVCNRMDLSLPYSKILRLPVTVNQYGLAFPVTVSQTTTNPVTTCLNVSGLCYSFPVVQADQWTPTETADDFVITPNRNSCNTTQLIVFTPEGYNPLTVNIAYQSYTFTINEATVSVPSTSASAALVTGSVGNGYVNGTLDGSSEWVYFTGDSSATQPLNAFTNSSGLWISFPDGYGVGSVTIKLCNQQLTRPVAYPQPNVAELVAYTYSTFQIKGSNFGKSRTNWPDYSVIFTTTNTNGTLRDINCIIDNNTDIDLNCTFQNDILVQDQPVNISVLIGSVRANLTINAFDPCSGKCQNGGKCISLDKCDCNATLYDGDYCTFKLQCTPECNINHGNCTRDYNSTAASPPNICVCEDGYSGQTCSSKIEDGNGTPVALIAGVVTAAGVVMLALVAVVVVLLIKNKNQRRGGKNFIPLHKKDFTKIIYGEQLNQDAEKSDADLNKLELMLVEDNLEVAVAVSNITQITEADKIAKALVVVFQDHDKVSTLLQAFIAEEVNTTESAGTLFRSNSMVSKMFKFYSRLIGLPYLYETIGPELCELIEEELGLEVDPEKMEEGTDLDEMRWMLMAQSQKILKSVLNSIEKCPPQFRVLFAHIKRCVAERFPENVNTTIGGFIFLRFFCPAVSSPEAYGIVEEPPSASARRLLILITKVLQNLSNDVEFGSKEPYMTKMNDFIHSNRQKLSDFYDKLVKPATKANVTCVLPKNMKAVSLSVIANHIKENMGKVDNPTVKSRLESVFSS